MEKTLEEILVTYQKKKEKKEKENELIKKELYRKYPEFDEIERKIAKLYLQKSIKNLTIKKQNIDKGEFIKIDEISNIDREIKKLEENSFADIVVIDLEKEMTINPKEFLSKGRNTPYANEKISGISVLTISNGKIAYIDEEEINL